jgi:hypothetical protein
MSDFWGRVAFLLGGGHEMTKAKGFTALQIIDDTFHDLALCLGGIFLVHQVQDRVVWSVMKGLDDLYVSARERAEQASPTEPIVRQTRDMTPHPAVEGFLQKIKGGAK